MSRILIVFLITILVFQSCKKDREEKLSFQWVKNGNTLYYDYYTDTGTIVENHRSLTITDNRFVENEPGASFYYKMFQLPYEELAVTLTGLNVRECGDCRFSLSGCMDEFTSIYAPAMPVKGKEMPQYHCSRNPGPLKLKILAVDTNIIVPLGSFKTYVVQLEEGDQVFWNADEGLIMYNRLDSIGGSLVGSLKLSKRSW